jgi:hypothetical protein
MHTRIHKTHHGSDLGEATIFPLIVFSVISHGGCMQMSFCLGIPNLGVPKFPKLRLLEFWKVITSYENLWLRWGLKQSCSPCQKLSNDIWHIIFTHLFKKDSWLLVGRNQIGTLTPYPSFGHNLCFKYSNGSCEPILVSYISKYFQLYKKLFDPMSFDLWNTSLKIWDSMGIPIPKVGIHLGMCGFIPSHSWECKCDFWIALSAHTFPCLCLGHEPKVRVVTLYVDYWEDIFLHLLKSLPLQSSTLLEGF